MQPQALLLVYTVIVLLHQYAFFTKLPCWWTLSSTDCIMYCTKGKLPYATTQLYFWYMFILHKHYIQQLPNTDPKQLHVSISIRNHFCLSLAVSTKTARPDSPYGITAMYHIPYIPGNYGEVLIRRIQYRLPN